MFFEQSTDSRTMTCVELLTPSGWTMTQLLNHLAFDDEMFWISAVLGGDATAIAGLHNGWASKPMTGAEAVNLYKREIARSDAVLAEVDLDAPPAGGRRPLCSTHHRCPMGVR